MDLVYCKKRARKIGGGIKKKLSIQQLLGDFPQLVGSLVDATTVSLMSYFCFVVLPFYSL